MLFQTRSLFRLVLSAIDSYSSPFVAALRIIDWFTPLKCHIATSRIAVDGEEWSAGRKLVEPRRDYPAAGACSDL